MYGQVAGAGLTAGVPAALAFTGIGGVGFAMTLGVALGFITVGIAVLRMAHRARS